MPHHKWESAYADGTPLVALIQDLKDINDIEKVLAITPVIGEELLSRCKKAFLRDAVNKAVSGGRLTSSAARQLREAAESLQLNLLDDMAMALDVRQKLFDAESGSLSEEDKESARLILGLSKPPVAEDGGAASSWGAGGTSPLLMSRAAEC
jgi:hypothetical protein